MTPSLSLTLAPPRTATNGRAGSLRSAEQHLDLPGQQPAGGADGRVRGGPTIEAWARCEAPKASLT